MFSYTPVDKDMAVSVSVYYTATFADAVCSLKPVIL